MVSFLFDVSCCWCNSIINGSNRENIFLKGSYREQIFINGSFSFSIVNGSYANIIYEQFLTSATAAKCSASAARTSGVFSGAMGEAPLKMGATGRVYS